MMLGKIKMNKSGSVWVAILTVLITFAALLAWNSDAISKESAKRPAREFGNLLYTLPAGFSAAGGAQGIMLASTPEVERGNVTAIIAIPREMKPDAKLKSLLKGKSKGQIAQAVAIAVGNLQQDSRAKFSDAVLVNNAALDGYEAHRVITNSFDKDAGKQRYSAVFVMFPGDLIHVVSANGFGSEKALESISPGLNALLGSIEFRNKGGVASGTRQPALPTSFATLAKPTAPRAGSSSARAPAAKGRRGGSCRIVQRQMCSGGFGSGMGYFCNTYPQSVCD
jgi:hypothetical protein